MSNLYDMMLLYKLRTGISSKFGSKSGSVSPKMTSGGKWGSWELNKICPGQKEQEISWLYRS